MFFVNLLITFSLRYCGTLKERKFESLFYKINTCLEKNYHLYWIVRRATILSKYITYIFFNFGRRFSRFFPMLFPKAPAFYWSKILNYFLLHCTSIFMSSKSVSQIFKILFQTGDINIFVLHSVFFLVDMFS